MATQPSVHSSTYNPQLPFSFLIQLCKHQIQSPWLSSETISHITHNSTTILTGWERDAVLRHNRRQHDQQLGLCQLLASTGVAT